MIEVQKENGYIDIFGEGCLIKADKKEKNVIYIEASNEFEDTQGDTLLQKALESQAENYLKKGVLSWDHMHKINNDPNFIVGEPLDVRFSKTTTLVKGKLYMANKYAQGILALAKSGSTRLGASVGGLITKRIERIDDLTKSVKKYITGVLWDETAITHKPINELTMGAVALIPYDVFCKSYVEQGTALYKALIAGSGTDSATMTGGRSLVAESLQGSKANKKKNLEKGFGKILKIIKSGTVESYKDFDSILLKHGLGDYRTQLMSLVIKNQKHLRPVTIKS